MMLKHLYLLLILISYHLDAQVEFVLKEKNALKANYSIDVLDCKTGQKIRLEKTTDESVCTFSLATWECSENIECCFETGKHRYSCSIPKDRLKDPGKYEVYITKYKRTYNLVLSDRTIGVQAPYLLKKSFHN